MIFKILISIIFMVSLSAYSAVRGQGVEPYENLLKCSLIYSSHLEFVRARGGQDIVQPVYDNLPDEIENILFVLYKTHARVIGPEGKRSLIRYSENNYIERNQQTGIITYWTYIKASRKIPYTILTKQENFDYIGPKLFTKVYRCY